MPGMHTDNEEGDEMSNAGMSRREFLRGVLRAGAAGAVVAYVPGRVLGQYVDVPARDSQLDRPIPDLYDPFPITPNGGDITLILEDGTEFTLYAATGPEIGSLAELFDRIEEQ